MFFSYLKGTIFVIVYALFLFITGNAILIKKHKSMPLKILVGYLINTFFLSIGGMLTQFFLLPWRIFFIYVLVFDGLCLVISLLLLFKNRDILTFSIKEFFKNYWVLLFCLIVLALLTPLYSVQFGFNGYRDDAYYITKMFVYPHMDHLYYREFTDGSKMIPYFWDLRNFNTFELEASVYLYLLKIPSTLFARLFLATANRIIVISSIYVLGEKFNEIMNWHLKKYYLQFFGLVILIISMNYNVIGIKHVAYYRDGWIMNFSNHLGTYIIMSCAFIWLFLIATQDKWNLIKKFIAFVIVSTVLISKSGIALPFIVASFLAYLCILVYKKNKMFIFPLLIVYTLVGHFIGNGGRRFIPPEIYFSEAHIDFFADNFTSILTIPIVIFVFYVLIKNHKNSITLYLGILITLLGLNIINNIVELASQYSFVLGRTIASLCFFMIMLGFILAFGLVLTESKLHIKGTLKTLSLVLVSLFILGSTMYLKDGNLAQIKYEIKLYKNNPYLTPNYVIKLADGLNEIDKKYNTRMYVLLPYDRIYDIRLNDTVFYNYVNYQNSIMVAGAIRQFAPNIVPISNILRMGGMYLDDGIKGFGVGDARIYVDYLNENSPKNYHRFKDMLDRYPGINTLVFYDNQRTDSLKKLGFSYQKHVADSNLDFYIYTR